MITGFYYLSMLVLLIEQGADYDEIAILSLIAIPFALKFLIAPVCDIYYLDWVGKRKTYILSSILLVSICNLIAA